MMLSLPGVIYRYFAAQAAADFDGMAACFAPTGSVRDRTGSAQGLASIREWLAARSVSGRTTQLLPKGPRNGATVILASVVGPCPEPCTPVEHRFRLQNGMIAALELC